MVRTPYVDKNGLKKGAWCPEEDEKLRSYIIKYGHWNWRELPKFAGLARCGKSCRLRWMNYLRPNVRHGNYSKEEEDLIVKLHEQLGNRWSKIAIKLPGRTDNEIKNHWHTHLKKLSQQHQTKNKKGRNRKCKEKSKPQEESNGNMDNNTTKSYPSVQILESCPIFPSSPQLSSTTTTEPSSSNSGSTSDFGLGSGSVSSTSSCLEDAEPSPSKSGSWDVLADLVDSSFWTEPFILDLDENQYQEHEGSLDANFWTDPFFDLENYENDRSLNFSETGVSYPYTTTGYLYDMDFSYVPIG